MGGDGNGRGGLAVGVGGVEGVGGGGRGGDGGGGGAGCAYGGGDYDVGGAGDLPGERDGSAGGYGGGTGGEGSDLRIGARGDVGAGVKRGDFDYVEIGGGDLAEVVEVIVVPAIVGSAGDVHGRAVVGHDETVFFHGVEDDLIGGGERGDVKGGFEAETGAHGKSVGVAGGGGPVGSRRSEACTGILQSETESMVDDARGDFVIAD